VDLNTTESKTIEIPLPEIYDANSDEFTVSLSGSTTYVTYDKATNKLIMDTDKASADITEETTLSVTIDITDSKGYSSSSTISITVQPASNSTSEPEELEEEVVEFVPEWDFGSQPTSTSQNDEDEVVEIKKLKGNIESITPRGYMDIVFNASMFTDFNLSILNSSNTDIYVEPAL